MWRQDVLAPLISQGAPFIRCRPVSYSGVIQFIWRSLEYVPEDYFSTKGFKVSFEEKVGEGATVDILASNADTSLAVEVETGKSDALRNIEKALSAGLTVLTVAASSEIEKKIKDQLSRQPQLDHGKVRIVNTQSCTWD